MVLKQDVSHVAPGRSGVCVSVCACVSVCVCVCVCVCVLECTQGLEVSSRVVKPG